MKHLAAAFLIAMLSLYAYARVNRYEFRPTENGFYVFDRWTTRIDAARLTKDHFVAEPRPAPEASLPISLP